MVKQYKHCLDKTTATTTQQMVEEGFFEDLRTAEAAKRAYDGCVIFGRVMFALKESLRISSRREKCMGIVCGRGH